jgi:thymidylate kinase
MGSEKVPVIAFEGINRVGKGTQIERLQKELDLVGLNSVVLRGDGTRDGKGEHAGDPYNEGWIANAGILRKGGTTHDWNEAALVLAQEFIEWRKKLAELDKQLILLDRSLISRGSFISQRQPEVTGVLEIQHLYPNPTNNPIKLEDVLPDVIFELVAPKEVVLSRLDQSDPKYEFRKGVITQTYDVFYSTKDRLPQSVRERIITLDSTRSVDEVFDDIIFNLNDLLELKK